MIDADDLGVAAELAYPISGWDFDGAIRWIIGLTIATIVIALTLAIVLSLMGRHRFGMASLALSVMLIVSVGVVVVVLDRSLHRDATLYDWVWAVALAVVAALSARRLLGTTCRDQFRCLQVTNPSTTFEVRVVGSCLNRAGGSGCGRSPSVGTGRRQ